jgi:hypothetical protein
MADTHVTLSLPEIQQLAGRLHARGTAPMGSDSSQSQSDMRLAATAIRTMLRDRIAAAEIAGQLSLRLSDVRVDVVEG